MSHSMARIGVTTYRERARWGVWNTAADVQFVLYADAVVRAGGLPLLLPPVGPALAEEAVDALDGLILTGGADVAPERYGAQRSPHTGATQSHRDEWEFALAEAALQCELPLLGICRGMQVLNVVLGGTLVQHLPDVVGHSDHGAIQGEFARHGVRFAPQSRLGQLLGSRIEVATHHHQAVCDPGRGLQPTGWADDGTIEALELAGSSWVLGVQWHPEAYDGAVLFAAFVAACVGASQGSRR